MSWLRATFVVPAGMVYSVSEELSELGVLSVSTTNAGKEEILEPSVGSTPMWENTQVEVLLSVDNSVSQLRALLVRHGITEVEMTFVKDQAWESTWREEVSARQFGRLWIAPRDWALPAESIAVRLDPGLAFGTGEHPTTAMCLQWLAQIDLRGKRVLDFGCGSGILGIAACKLGASQVTAIDHDPQAIEATIENAKHNNVAIEVQTEIGLRSSFDVIVSNILLRTLVELAEEFTSALASGGALALSGLLDGQQDAIRKKYRTINFTTTTRDADWLLMVGRES